MTALCIDLDRLHQTVLRLRRFEAFLEDRLGQVDRSIRDLHGSWLGDASTAHLQAHQEWVRGAEEMRSATGALRLAAAIAHENYASAVRANARGWSR